MAAEACWQDTGKPPGQIKHLRLYHSSSSLTIKTSHRADVGAGDPGWIAGGVRRWDALFAGDALRRGSHVVGYTMMVIEPVASVAGSSMAVVFTTASLAGGPMTVIFALARLAGDAMTELSLSWQSGSRPDGGHFGTCQTGRSLRTRRFGLCLTGRRPDDGRFGVCQHLTCSLSMIYPELNPIHLGHLCCEPSDLRQSSADA